MTKTTPLIRCSFFGGFRIFNRDGVEQRFPVAKGAALIAYLALSPWARATRGELTGLLWSERPETTARTALRQCRYQMKSVLATVDSSLVSSTPDSIFLDLEKLSCDTDALFAEKKTAILDSEFDPDSLLKGFEDLDPAFEEWLRQTRLDVEQKLLGILRDILEDKQANQQDILRAASWLQRLDPSQEKAGRLLIEDAANRNDQVAMLEAYTKLWNALDENWGEEPSASLQHFVGEARMQLNQPIPPDIETKRKVLTILAMRLSTEAGASYEPEEIASARTAMVVQARQVISEFNGVILNANEEGIRAAFGLPLVGEMDAHNSVEASIDLCEALEKHPGLSGAIGLDSGVLLTEASPGSNSPRVVGSSLDLAITLSHQKGERCIFATEHTVRSLHNSFLIQEEHPLTLDQPAIVRVTGRKPAVPVSAPAGKRYKFIGRENFLATLEEVWSETQQVSDLRIVSIEGPAGIGKTRLADEFLQRLADQDTQIARAICNVSTEVRLLNQCKL
ncbi:hypothetical protein N9K16_05465 [Alphaproteobacteria bacterium]|nr:hypothetical protein [Alphaproteobacteria bacterium]